MQNLLTTSMSNDKSESWEELLGLSWAIIDEE